MSDAMKHQLDDIALKLRSARDAANRPGATEKDKADLKLIEQDYIAAYRARRRLGHGQRGGRGRARWRARGGSWPCLARTKSAEVLIEKNRESAPEQRV